MGRVGSGIVESSLPRWRRPRVGRRCGRLSWPMNPVTQRVLGDAQGAGSLPHSVQASCIKIAVGRRVHRRSNPVTEPWWGLRPLRTFFDTRQSCSMQPPGGQEWSTCRERVRSHGSGARVAHRILWSWSVDTHHTAEAGCARTGVLGKEML